MNSRLEKAWMLTVGLVLVVATPGCSPTESASEPKDQGLGNVAASPAPPPPPPPPSPPSARPKSVDKEVIAEIERLGGSVLFDETSPDRPLIAVILKGTEVTDASLEHLKEMTSLRSLDLIETEVTDAGLEHLKGLTKLRTLLLGGTQVTDEGVKKLQQALPNCDIRHKRRR